MSIKIMTAVWNVSLPHADKIVLLALADNASDDGKCFPSMTTLMEKCGLEDRSIQRVLLRLEEAGHITRHLRPGRSTVYSVHPRPTVTPTESHPDGKSPPTVRHPPPTDGHHRLLFEKT